MTLHVLDNPIWHSLAGRHRAFALGGDGITRYPRDIAPFLGVEDDGIDAAPVLDTLVPAGDAVMLLGPTPRLPAGWQLDGPVMLAQMVCDAPTADVDGPDIELLTRQHRDDLLALTALVYPHYFRPRTMALGRYFGIYREGRLAAMIGERMAPEGWREISAVCTHPDFNGRGYARRLLAWLSNDVLARGLTPFLHVSHENTRALAMYARNGYRLRRDIPFWSMRRNA